jgi:tetratricopeptide (TPR) repeat protein
MVEQLSYESRLAPGMRSSISSASHIGRRSVELGFFVAVALFSLGCGPSQTDASLSLAEAKRIRATLEEMPEALDWLLRGNYSQAHDRLLELERRLPTPERFGGEALLDLEDGTSYRRHYSALLDNLGLSLLRMRRPERALPYLEKAVEADPTSASPRRNLGVALLHVEAYERAARELELARRLGAASARHYYDLGRACSGAGRPARARWAFIQARRASAHSRSLEDWGVSLEASRELARLHLLDGELLRAEELLRDVLQVAPGEVQSRYLLVQTLGRLGRTGEVEAQRQLFERDSALVAVVQGELKASPGRVDALRLVADTYRQLGLLHLADVHYRQLLARDPGDRHARLALVKLRQQVEALPPPA